MVFQFNTDQSSSSGVELTHLPLLLLCDMCNWMSANMGWILFGAVMFYLWYYLFWKPFDWYRDFTHLGFDDVDKSYSKYSSSVKRNVINELRKRRKIGDLPPAYPNGWFVIAESEQIGHLGVKEINVLGLNLVAWRGESGQVYVADAYCPHLGAHLGVGGKVNKECIKCPFHGWEFQGGNGQLSRIPYSTSCKPELAKLKMWTSLERNGFVYLWYHAEEDSPSWYPEAIPELESGKWVYRGRSEFRVACHVQEIPENGADINHLNIVHTPALMTGEKPDNAIISWGGIQHVWSGQWKPSDEPGKRHTARLELSTHVNILNLFSFMKMDVQVVQIGPGIVHLEFNTPLGKGILFHMVTPIEPLLQKVTHRLYTARTFVHPWAKLILLGEAIMISRDISIWNRKMYIKSPVIPKEDAGLKRFRMWYNQFYSENSPRNYLTKNDSNDNSLDF